jgi:subtilase family serine protease
MKLAVTLVLALFFLTSSPAIVLAIFPNNHVVNSSTSSGLMMVPGPLVVLSNSREQPSCSTYNICPSTYTKAYGFSNLFASGTNGKGQTIAIVDACGDSTIATDLQTFDKQFGLPNPTFKVIDVEGKPQTCDSSWGVETALDVEWSHVAAPGAAIDLLVSSNAGAPAMYQAWTYVLKHNLANQISDSFGGAGCGIKMCNNTIGEGIGPCNLTNGTQGVPVENILERAQDQRVTVLGASGDGGAYGLGHGEEGIPMDCLGIMTVGGTTLQVSSGGKYLGEVGWGGSGGGYMTAPHEAYYQKAANIKDSFGTLAKPDVAADASTSSPLWICYGGSWGTVAGTSAATPVWAGFIADVNQIRASHGFKPVGFVVPFLYKDIYTQPSLYKLDFHDVTSGNNGWPAGKGWDAVTGLGSFVVPNLAKTLGNTKSA